MELLNKLSRFLKKEKMRDPDPLEQSLDYVVKDPGNARAHLKLAEIYQKKGEKRKAISEYLLAAEIFAKNNQYVEAMAIYKQVPKQDPSLDHVYLKIADIYRKMGFLGDAFAQYRILVNHYDKQGRKDKALGIMGLMAELDPRKIALEEKVQNLTDVLILQKVKEGFTDHRGGSEGDGCEGGKKKNFFDLNAELEMEGPVELGGSKEISTLEKVYGFEDILKELKEVTSPSLAYPNFNYYMGLACREMGFFDDAVEQFQVALEKGQNPFEAANMLGLFFKEKNRWDEACRAFEKALAVEGIPQEKKLEVKYELGLIYKELGKIDEALQLLREISAMDQDFLTTKGEAASLTHKLGSQKNRLKI
jgi:tetratricopeptide (TPR) repeat protein